MQIKLLPLAEEKQLTHTSPFCLSMQWGFCVTSLFVDIALMNKKYIFAMESINKTFYGVFIVVAKYIASVRVISLYLGLRGIDKSAAQATTPLHWSGFLRSFDAAKAQLVRRGSAFSSLKQVICSNVDIISVIAASCAFESEISSSYNEKACVINS
uniref:Uncharacterized protein n=1 Tax=Glossina palpalis gambiensis TaxID=67801 RepID=A0A1B0BKG4_9MUSC